MKPVETEHSNAVFVLEGCLDLPATKCHDKQNGTSYVESCWEMTEEERAEVMKTGRVFVTMMGETVPPLLVSVESMVDDE